jgi:hypothetical protein
MNSKDRFIVTLEGGKADRMPVTMHHIMPSFLEDYMGGISDLEFFDFLGIDPINWVMAYQYSPDKGEYFDPLHTSLGFLEARRICSDNWQIELEPLEDARYSTQRFSIVTPDKKLSMVLQSNEHTTWLAEHLVKEKSEIDIIAKYMTYPLCDVQEINRAADEFGGGDASTTVISPDIFNEFVAPYDAELIEAAHQAGQRVVYHTCGGMMPILEDIAAMKPDAMETFTPAAMGGDVNLREAKQRIGGKVCMIGGLDQFFEADTNLLKAFADEALKCTY